MIFIPGFIISLLTFPGVIIHEIAHRFFLDLAKVPVYSACYFQISSSGIAGYITHGPVKKLSHHFLVSIAPLLVNTVLCAILTFPAYFTFFILGTEDHSKVFELLFWVGFSIGMHAFPSKEDMNSFVDAVLHSKPKGLLFICTKIFAGFVSLINALRFFWFDAFYAFFIAILIPRIFWG